MDILNFISWIRGGRVVTTVDPTKTLIPVGLKDDRRDDGYLAGAITVEDLAVQVGGLQTVAVDGITITGDGTLGDPLVAAAVPTASYKVYTALVKPNGTNNPIVTVIENELGTIDWTYDPSGPLIKCAGIGIFTPSKTFVLNTSIISYGTAVPLHIQSSFDNVNQLLFLTTDVNGNRINVVANNSFSIEIRVYN